MAARPDDYLKKQRDQLAKLTDRIPDGEFPDARTPKAPVIVRDRRALRGGIQAPHHRAVKAEVMAQLSADSALGEMVTIRQATATSTPADAGA